MTRSFSALAMSIGGLLASGGWAFGAQPPDVVHSDAGQNTAMGDYALLQLMTGYDNTASGYSALISNITGSYNTAVGAIALANNTIGSSNTACGMSALLMNTSGYWNTGDGFEALYRNTTGSMNTASGTDALLNNGAGNNNAAFGADALYSNTSGSYNIALGVQAGSALTIGSSNIDIGNSGVAGESGTIRIGASGSHTATYVAGIARTPLEGAQVVISRNGQLGVLASSERYKTDIEPMGSNSAKLRQLHPVTFHLKANPNGTLQYGLIAEQVDKVYPDLVIRDDTGTIQGVRYDELAPMLLNEVQLEQKQLAAQADAIADQEKRLRDLQQQFADLMAVNQAMQATLVKLEVKPEQVAKF